MKLLAEIIFGIIIFPILIILVLIFGTIKAYTIYHDSFKKALKGE